MALIAVGGFLPVIAFRAPVARWIWGGVAAAAGCMVIWMAYEASRPGLGLVVGAWLFLLVRAAAVDIALLGIGLGVLLSRGIARLRHRAPSPALTVVLSVMLPLLLISAAWFVPTAQREHSDDRFYEGIKHEVTTAGATARPQSKEQLIRRVQDAMTAVASHPGAGGDVFARDALLPLFHPAVLKNDEYFGAYPGQGRRTAYVQDEHIGRLVEGQFRWYFRPEGEKNPWDKPAGALGSLQRGDRLTSKWGSTMTLDGVETRVVFFGRDLSYGDGTELFPSAHFHQLDVARTRGKTTEPFTTLYAVDDRGNWWLVGVRNPHFP